MNLLTGESSLLLWQEVVKDAEQCCAVKLKDELEIYLVSLLDRYINRPDVVKKMMATSLLEALQLKHGERQLALQNVGDQCLLVAGLFPRLAPKRHVKLSYFVDIGRSAYGAASTTNDLYGCLAVQFVILMDVLQSIRPSSDLLPLEAYEQWESVGSERALKLLKLYTHSTTHSH